MCAYTRDTQRTGQYRPAPQDNAGVLGDKRSGSRTDICGPSQFLVFIYTGLQEVLHAVLPGGVVAYALGLPFSLGAFVFGVGSVAAIGFVKQKSRVKEDTVIGLVFTGFFALGLVSWLYSRPVEPPSTHRDTTGHGTTPAGATDTR